MFIWYIVAVILILIASCEFYALKTGVPTVTSFPAARKKMIELLKAEEMRRGAGDKTFTILDLGSGTGKLTLEIGRALPKADIIGLEISVLPFFLSRLRRFFWRAKNVVYRREDFWLCDLSSIDAIVLYMNAKIRDRMAEKLKELPPGALILSNETHLPGWTPTQTHKVGVLKLEIVAYRR